MCCCSCSEKNNRERPSLWLGSKRGSMRSPALHLKQSSNRQRSSQCQQVLDRLLYRSCSLVERHLLSLSSWCNGCCCEYFQPGTTPQSWKAEQSAPLFTSRDSGRRQPALLFRRRMGSIASVNALSNATPLDDHAAMASSGPTSKNILALNTHPSPEACASRTNA
jgi:hypothetical protein